MFICLKKVFKISFTQSTWWALEYLRKDLPIQCFKIIFIMNLKEIAKKMVAKDNNISGR